MRRFLTTSLAVLALLTGATGAAPVAHAQFVTNPVSFSSVSNGSGPGELLSTLPGAGDSSALLNNASYTSAVTQPAPVPRASGASCPVGTHVDLSNSANCVPDVQAAAGNAGGADTAGANVQTNPNLAGDTANQMGTVITWIMSLFAWLVGVAALTLDYAVYYTVITMGDYVQNLSAIGVSWRILRDIANIMFIFGFLGAGIATILNVDLYGWKTKMLPMLFVGAIFLNFSLFTTEALIDVSNLFATQFFMQINGGQLPTKDSLSKITLGTFGSGSVGNEGISNKIMSQLGLQSIYGETQRNQKALEGNHTWLIGFMGILLFLTTAFVMFSLAFILIARFVALIFFLILSPIGFMGLAIPQMKFRAGQWWGNFLEQIITAPVLLLLLYVALAVITDVQFLAGFNTSSTGGWLGFVNGDNLTGFAGVLLPFLVAIGLLFVVVIKAKGMSAFGANMATKAAGAATLGVTAWGLRSTAGRGLQRTSQWARKKGFARTNVGKMVVGGLDRGAKASFDIRGSKAFGDIAKGRFDAGEAQKGGFRKWEEDKFKEHKDYAKSLKQTGDEAAREAEWKSREDEQKEVHKTEIANLKAEHEAELRPHNDAIEAQLKKVKQLRATAEASKSDADKKALADAELTLSNQNKERDDVKKKQEATASNLKAAQEATMKNITDQIAEAKRSPQMKYAENLTSGLNKVFRRATNQEAAKKIVEEAKKSKSEKELEILKKVIDDAEHPKDDHGKKDSGSHDKPKSEPKSHTPAGGGGGSHH